jgi:putative membrane protein
MLLPALANAHVSGAYDLPPRFPAAFTLDPLLLVPLIACLLAYAIGLRRVWRIGTGTGVSTSGALLFAGGWLVLALAMIWPLDALGEWSLAAHMTQHMLLMAAAPPLLLAGRPEVVLLLALPTSIARWIARPSRSRAARSLSRILFAPTAAMLVQGTIMWSWHAPGAMAAALRNDLIHYAMHASFLAAGLIFWIAMGRSVREPAAGAAAGAVAIVGTMMQMGLLGALLTFAARPRYPHYVDRAPHLGLTALEDQQLAGLIMWVPTALPYLVGGLVLIASWLRRSARADARQPCA